jgi:hypothetical protein
MALREKNFPGGAELSEARLLRRTPPRSGLVARDTVRAVSITQAVGVAKHRSIVDFGFYEAR